MVKRVQKKESDIYSYWHGANKCKNAVSVGLAFSDTLKLNPPKNRYDPHLDPQLQWAGKAEYTSIKVSTVSLYIHEKIAPEVARND